MMVTVGDPVIHIFQRRPKNTLKSHSFWPVTSEFRIWNKARDNERNT